MHETLSSLNAKMVFRAVRNVRLRTLYRFTRDYYSERKEIERQMKSGTIKPTSMYIEVTSFCPKHQKPCKDCYIPEDERRDPKIMSLETARTAVAMAKGAGIKLYNFMGGETITRSTLPLVETILRENPDVSFFCVTNSGLLSTKNKFLEPLVSMHNIGFGLSIDGFQATNDSLRGKGSFGRVVLASEFLRSHKCFFSAVVTLRPENRVESTSDKFLEFLAGLGVSYVVYSLLQPSLASEFRKLAASEKSRPILLYCNELGAQWDLSPSLRTRMVYVTKDERLLNDRRERIEVSNLSSGFGAYPTNEDYLKRFR